MTAEQKLLHMTWKRAFEVGKVELPQKTANDAVRLRLALYSSVKRVKEVPSLDFALAQAANECFINLGADGKTVTIQTKSSTDTAKSMMDMLGITKEDLVDMQLSGAATGRVGGLAPASADLPKSEQEVLNSMFSGPLAGLISKE